MLATQPHYSEKVVKSPHIASAVGPEPYLGSLQTASQGVFGLGIIATVRSQPPKDIQRARNRETVPSIFHFELWQSVIEESLGNGSKEHGAIRLLCDVITECVCHAYPLCSCIEGLQNAGRLRLFASVDRYADTAIQRSPNCRFVVRQWLVRLLSRQIESDDSLIATIYSDLGDHSSIRAVTEGGEDKRCLDVVGIRCPMYPGEDGINDGVLGKIKGRIRPGCHSHFCVDHAIECKVLDRLERHTLDRFGSLCHSNAMVDYPQELAEVASSSRTDPVFEPCRVGRGEPAIASCISQLHERGRTETTDEVIVKHNLREVTCLSRHFGSECTFRDRTVRARSRVQFRRRSLASPHRWTRPCDVGPSNEGDQVPIRDNARGRRWSPVWSLFLVLAVALAACSGSAEAVPQTPGDGVQVDMARANWSTGYFQAAIVTELLGELGYEVTDPAQTEMAPDLFFPALAAGDVDMWVNTWIPSHGAFLRDSTASGGTIADDISLVGGIVGGGAFQGFLVDVATAEANGIKYLDDIADDPAMAALFDVDGDGKADLTGCNEGWGCNVLIEDLIAANGWEATIAQVVGDFDALWAAEVEGFAKGEPVLSYVWAPSAYIAQLVPGQDVLWLSVRRDLGDSSEIALPPSQCPGQPCQLGLALNEIMAAGNRVFFDANPAVERLASVVGIPLTDVAVQNLKMLLGEDSEADVKRHAAEWIADNRTVVDSWLDAARVFAAG